MKKLSTLVLPRGRANLRLGGLSLMALAGILLAASLRADADLSLIKTVPLGSSVLPGSVVTYNIFLSNLTASPASNVVLTDNLPANTTFLFLTPPPGGFSCTSPAVGASGAVVCTAATVDASLNTVALLSVRAAANAPEGTVITNVAAVTSDTADPNPGNNIATAAVTVHTPTSDWSVTDVVSTPTIGPGGMLQYTITFQNNGPDGSGFDFETSIPNGTQLQSITYEGTILASCSSPPPGYTGAITCTGLAGLGSVTAHLTVTLNPGAGPVITSTATIQPTSPSIDPNPSNNSAVATANVVPPVVPTLGSRALLLFVLLLAGVGLWMARR